MLLKVYNYYHPTLYTTHNVVYRTTFYYRKHFQNSLR